MPCKRSPVFLDKVELLLAHGVIVMSVGCRQRVTSVPFPLRATRALLQSVPLQIESDHDFELIVDDLFLLGSQIDIHA